MMRMNEDGVYELQKMLPPGQDGTAGNLEDLFVRLEKSAFELEKRGFLMEMLPSKMQRQFKRMEDFSDYDKRVCKLINTRADNGRIVCPDCGKINGTFDMATEKIRFNGTFVDVAYRKCWNCKIDLFWFYKLKYGTRKARLSDREVLEKRKEYLDMLEGKKKEKDAKMKYLKRLAQNKREETLKKRGMVGKPGDSWKMW